MLYGSNVRDYCLISGLVLYATLSTPFPQSPGLVEAFVGCLFLAYAGANAVVHIGGGYALETRPAFPAWLYFIFSYLLTVPFLVGIWHQWDFRDLVRDLIPLIYLFIPIILMPAMLRSNRDWSSVLPMFIALAGVLFSVRFFIETGASPLSLGSSPLFDNFLYLPYDPSVLFAAIFLPLKAIQRPFTLARPISLCRPVVLGFGGLIAFAALASVVQRAPVALVGASILFYLICSVRHSPVHSLVSLMVLGTLYYLFQSQVQSMWTLLLAKQELVGVNAKDEEFLTVLSEVGSRIDDALFGLGWGGVYFSPAYAALDAKVSYTHSLMTYALLKSGLLGLAAVLAYLSFLLLRVQSVFTFRNMPVTLAAGSSLLIGLLFQPSFKVLTYGFVMLTVVYLSLVQNKACRQGTSCT